MRKAMKNLSPSLNLGFVLLAGMLAQSPALAKDLPKAAKSALERLAPQAKIVEVHAGPIKGWYEVVLDGQVVVYIEGKGKAVVHGEWYDGNGQSVTERRRAVKAKEVIASYGDKLTTVVYEANGRERGRVFVFFDPTCGFCRRLHEEVKPLNENGVTVVYIPIDRGGSGPTAEALSKVLCGSNPERQASFEAYLKGEFDGGASGCKADITENFAMFRAIGARGTPAIYTVDGMSIGGYLPAEQLLRRLGITK